MNVLKQYRQGDVNLFHTTSGLVIPEGAEKVERDQGGLVMAYGEVSGHAHAVYEGKAELYMYTPDQYDQVAEQLGGMVMPDGAKVFRSEALTRQMLETSLIGFLDVTGGAYLVHGNLGLKDPGTTQDHNQMWLDEGIHVVWQQREYRREIRRMAD